MKEAKRSFVATIGVLVVIGTVVFGGLLRNRMEIGEGLSVGGPISMDSIVSNDDPEIADTATDPISESAFFYQLTLLLEREFVDPVEQNEDLAIGAVRGMVNSLADSYSLFYNKEQMNALLARRTGVFEGIGVEITLKYDEEELSKLQNASLGSGGADSDVNFDPALLIPSVVVSTVVADGPADLAGMKVGDRITRINGKWAISSLEVIELRKYQGQVVAGDMTADELQTISEDFRNRAENSLQPSRASDLLMIGTSGLVTIEWDDTSGDHQIAEVSKRTTRLPSVELNDGTVSLRFFKNSLRELKTVGWPDGGVVLDLRQSTHGDYNVMRDCLSYFGGQGNYGIIKSSQAGSQRVLQTAGDPFDHKIKLIVDDSTRGAAAIFASALLSSGKAELIEGELTTDLSWVEIFKLPGGTGYTLRTGNFLPNSEGSR